MSADPVVVWALGMVAILAVSVAAIWVGAVWAERRERRGRR
jgi:membrane protein implicated in regulation of membrane protease activity